MRIARLQHVRLLDDLAGIAQQLGAVVRERHAAVAAREHGDAQLLFEILTAVDRLDCDAYRFWAAALVDPYSAIAMR